MGIFKRKKEEIGESILHLKPSTPIEITLEYNYEIKYFYSKLVDILSEKEIIIAPPRSIEGNIVKLSEKHKYKIRLKTVKGLFENVMSIKSYVVQHNDTLWKLAKKFNTTIDDNVSLNDIENPDLIYPGQKLLILKKVC